MTSRLFLARVAAAVLGAAAALPSALLALPRVLPTTPDPRPNLDRVPFLLRCSRAARRLVAACGWLLVVRQRGVWTVLTVEG